MNLYIDIETVPTQRIDLKDAILEGVVYEEPRPPGVMRKKETIEKWKKEEFPAAQAKAKEKYNEEREKKYRDTALDGTLGEVLCISWAIDDGKINHVIRSLEQSEATVLIQFNEAMKSVLFKTSKHWFNPVWIGHYISGFDIRFLWQRYVINRIKPDFNIPIKSKPWDDDIFDTKMEWSGNYKKDSSKLDFLCKVFRFNQKGDLDGSKVWDYAQEGRFEEIAQYCDDDVDRVRNLYKAMRFL